MAARKAALVVVVSLTAVFGLRTVATIFPNSTADLRMALLATGVQLASALAILVFFFHFYVLAANQDRESLRQASGVAVVGAGFAILVPIQSLLQILDVTGYTPFGRSRLIELYAPLLASLAFVFFFTIYRREFEDEERAALRMPTVAALMGFSIMAVMHLIVIALALRSEEVLWLTEMGPTVAIGTLPIVAAAFAAIVYFFVAYFRHQPVRSEPDRS